MEHLSHPSGRAIPAIPYVVRDAWAYDGLGFMSFPSRKGLTIEILKNGPNSQISKGNLLSFMQSWLFFGLLHDTFAACGITVGPEDFIRQAEDGSQWLNTAILPHLVVVWESKARDSSDSKKNKQLEQIDENLSRAQSVLRELANAHWITGSTHYSSVTSLDNSLKVLLSLVIIGEALTFARATAYQNRQLRVPVAIGKEAFSKWPSLGFLNDCLAGAGWCAFEIGVIDEQVDNSCRYFLGMLDRSKEAPKHTRCTRSKCTLNGLDRATYRTLHVNGSCHCQSLQAETAAQPAISEILYTGHTPLVRLVTSDNGSKTLEALSSKDGRLFGSLSHKLNKNMRETGSRWVVQQRDSRPTIPYVAISHVWRGGLGNPVANSLPLCQLERIQTLVNNLYGSHEEPMPFWMDTLCVPLERTTRSLAIQGMKSVYQSAEKVLVIDTFLELSNLSQNLTENLMRIRSSTWMQRLWTLQEGILAQSLYFQFADGASVRGEDLIHSITDQRKDHLKRHSASIDELSKQRTGGWKAGLHKDFRLSSTSNPWTGRHPPVHDTITLDACQAFRAVRIANSRDSKTLLKKQHESEVLSQFSSCLRWRRTSVTRDEALVLTNIMGLKTSDLIDVQAEITMQRVFQSVSAAPVDLLFVPREHLRDQACSWIPKSLIHGPGHRSLGPREGAVTKHGFSVKQPGIIFTDAVHWRPNITIPISDKGGAVYSITPSFLESDLPGGQSSWAIVLQRPLGKQTSVPGALVQIEVEKSKRISARWYGVTQIRPEPRASPSMRNQSMEAHVTSSDREWCII